MHLRKKTIITIETMQCTFVLPLPQKVPALCERCGVERMMIAPEQAASILQTTPTAISSLLEEKKLHSVETEPGLILICCNSLLELTNEEKE